MEDMGKIDRFQITRKTAKRESYLKKTIISKLVGNGLLIVSVDAFFRE